MIGIPYASHARGKNGELLPNVVICPVCKKRIRETVRKDFESFSGNAYAKHYAKMHAPSQNISAEKAFKVLGAESDPKLGRVVKLRTNDLKEAAAAWTLTPGSIVQRSSGAGTFEDPICWADVPREELVATINSMFDARRSRRRRSAS